MPKPCIICGKEDEFSKNSGKCIFHCEKEDWYKEEKKEWGELMTKRFWKEVREEKMAKKDYDFSHFIFPEFEDDYDCMEGEHHHKESFFLVNRKKYWLHNREEREFDLSVNFKNATFLGKANFWRILFDGEVNFSEVNFYGEVTFEQSDFKYSANFKRAHFYKDLSFWRANFFENIYFTLAEFQEEAKFQEVNPDIEFEESKITCCGIHFSSSKFHKNAIFDNTYFCSILLYFNRAEFFDNASFENTTIKILEKPNLEKGIMSFEKAHFYKKANFKKTKFLGKAEEIRFRNMYFSGKTIFEETESSVLMDFSNTHFEQKTRFIETKFKKSKFDRSIFSDKHQTLFKKTQFLFKDPEFKIPTASFSNINFPKTVEFHECDLSHASFLDSDTIQVRFDECKWGYLSPVQRIWNRKIIGWLPEKRKMLWNEKNILQKSGLLRSLYQIFKDCIFRKLLRQKSDRYEKVEGIYRDLKKNFDEKKDYQSADSFYAGEREMERRRSLVSMEFAQYFFLSIYKTISDYNLNPTKALQWLIFTIVIFSFLFLYFLSNCFFSTTVFFFCCLFISLVFWIILRILSHLSGDKTSPSFIVNFNFIFFLIYFFATDLIKPPISMETLNQSFQYSLTSSVPLLSFPLKTEDPSPIMFLHYFQIIFSTTIWTLLILSLRRKFKR